MAKTFFAVLLKFFYVSREVFREKEILDKITVNFFFDNLAKPFEPLGKHLAKLLIWILRVQKNILRKTILFEKLKLLLSFSDFQCKTFWTYGQNICGSVFKTTFSVSRRNIWETFRNSHKFCYELILDFDEKSICRRVYWAININWLILNRNNTEFDDFPIHRNVTTPKINKRSHISEKKY